MTRLNIKKISIADKYLLRKAVLKWRPCSKNYEDSWGYIIQATRHDGFRLYDPETNSLIFFGRKNPTDPTLVFPTFFARPAYVRQAINTIQKQIPAPQVILKNISHSEITQFTPFGFRQYHEDERWGTFARFDDQTFPQQIAELTKLIKQEGREYYLLRKMLRKKPSVYIREYRNSDKQDVLRVFVARDANEKRTLSEQQKGMYFESHVMYPDSNLKKFVVVSELNNEILGFTAYSTVTSETAAFVAFLFKPNLSVVNCWGIYQTILRMHKNKFRYVNFGGNETEGSYEFVRRTFRPFEKLSKTHLIYDNQG